MRRPRRRRRRRAAVAQVVGAVGHREDVAGVRPSPSPDVARCSASHAAEVVLLLGVGAPELHRLVLRRLQLDRRGSGVMPVPAGMSLPMMMFSLRPSSRSLLPSMAASVSTRVVSWNDAADSHESVASDALVMPMSSGRPSAGVLPSCTSAAVDLGEDPRSRPARRAGTSESPGSCTATRRSIWRTISSMCLSWIDTPWSRYTFCTSSTRYCCVSRMPLISRSSFGSLRGPLDERVAGLHLLAVARPSRLARVGTTCSSPRCRRRPRP